MAHIEGLPQYEIIGVNINWTLKELKFEVKLDRSQYDSIKSSSVIEMPAFEVSFVSEDHALDITSTNKVAKMCKLVVHKTQYVGEFVLPFTTLTHKEINTNHG